MGQRKGRITRTGLKAIVRAESEGTVAIRPGPRKPRSPGPPPPRLVRHKARAAWFRAHVAWPLREAPIAKLLVERRRALTLAAATQPAEWQLVGPTNIGGRCTSLVCDPTNPDHVWIGAAGGGVWESLDAGRKWRPRWRSRTPLEIGALALDPSAPTTLYCGTGEANLSADSYPGDGIYRSINGGKSWKMWAKSATTGVPRRIGVIAVDPFDSTHVLVGGVGFGKVSRDNDFGGMYETSDSGLTWRRTTFIATNNYWCHSIVFNPTTQGTVLATFTGPGARSGIYKTTNGGSTWTQLKTGLPPADRMGRTSLALAPSNPHVVYALSSDNSSGMADRVLGVFMSANGGTSWTNIARSHFKMEGQMSYGNAIAVHPHDPNRVICGGVDLHVTRDGGTNWRTASHWDAQVGTPRYAHADHHTVVAPSAASGRVYSANDGGLDVSEDFGGHWENRSNGLSVTMFYDIDCAQGDSGVYGGGAQDNGTVLTTSGHSDAFFELLGGDGGWMVVDPNDPGHIYASYQYGGMHRFRNGSGRDVSPPFKKDESSGVWMVYITIDPNDSNVVYTGNQRVYRTKNDGLSWDALTPVLDGSPISAIEIAVASSKVVYVGTENGGFFRSLDGGVNWSANLAGPLPAVMITRIETHPTKAREVYVTLGNFGNAHVFRSTDAGSVWADIDGGKLPDVPHHAVLILPDAPKSLYVCNDAGVFQTKDGGRTWLNATSNLPNVMVVDLVYRVPTKTLMAATYGRSIWQLKLV